MDQHSTIPSFSSKIWAGFECTYALVEKEERFDLLAASRHDAYYRQDYKLIKSLGINTVREGLAWHQIDTENGYDFSRFEPIMQAAREEGIEQIWDLNHFDYPADVDIFSDTFISRFAEYAKQCIQTLRKYHSGILYIVPVNEISFSAWIGADRGLWYPYRHGPNNGLLLKKQLVRASIAAMDAIWAEDTEVRFIQVDPIMNRTARDKKRKDLVSLANEFNERVRFEAWDMLSGAAYPELGGNPKYLDIIGINYYAINQEWIQTYHDTEETYFVMIPPDHPAHISFAHLLKDIYTRYKRPMVISETGSHGEYRPTWWETILKEIADAEKQNLSVLGICAYPVLDKPGSLHFLWPQSGLFDFDPVDPACQRIPHKPTLEVITKYIRSCSA